MEGGRLIGEGTYGCVFQPPLLCKKKQILKSKVGKLTSEEDMIREVTAAKVLSKIKETKYYFLLTVLNRICGYLTIILLSKKIIKHYYFSL